MSLKNTNDTYGSLAKILHWVIGLAVIALVIVGLTMGDYPDMIKKDVYFWHKSIGMMMLAAIIFRFGWRLYSKPPASLPSHKTWEKILAKTIHYLFYIALIVMPMSGWLMSDAKGYPVNVANLFTLPHLIEPNDDLGKLFRATHGYAGYVLIGCFFLHVAGALKHHFVDKDSTLKRMLFSK